MRVSGLTILRNAVTLDYPFREAIRSGLPLCDEFVVVVGRSTDGTLDAVRNLGDPKIRIIETEWADNVTPRKCLLAQQTNIGLHQCGGEWVLYLQGNEVLHEASIRPLVRLMQAHEKDRNIEALLFERLTFWGDYWHCVGVYPDRFKFTPRVIRPNIGTYSIRDAMSFAVFDGFSIRGRYPRVLDTGEYIYRYGFACSPTQLKRKTEMVVHEMRCPAQYLDDDFFYHALPRRSVRDFLGTHPAVMAERIRTAVLSLSLQDPRWRRTATPKEWRRMLETWFYERFGVPRFRSKRYVLIGDYKRKPQSVMEPTRVGSIDS